MLVRCSKDKNTRQRRDLSRSVLSRDPSAVVRLWDGFPLFSPVCRRTGFACRRLRRPDTRPSPATPKTGDLGAKTARFKRMMSKALNSLGLLRWASGIRWCIALSATETHVNRRTPMQWDTTDETPARRADELR